MSTLENKHIAQIIKEHFEEEPEVYEVAMYALSVLTVNDAVLRGMMSNLTEVQGIPPESIHIMKRFDNGLTLNKFWISNFAPIKMQLAMDDIKLNSMSHYINYGEQSKDKQAFEHARAILLSRCDVLTMIAFIWKGVKYAEDFDAKFRISLALSDKHKSFFESKGI